MHERWIKPDAVFENGEIKTNAAVCITDGQVSSVVPEQQVSKDAQKWAGILAPGFVDLQVNGGGGVLFNQTPTPGGITAIAQAHYGLGTGAIMPTVITDHADVLARAVEALLASQPDPKILGIHIEGPHISKARQGTHDPRFIRPLDDMTLSHVARLIEHKITVKITVAPEVVGIDAIRQIADMGAIVSLGHSDTDATTAHAAFDAGAHCTTHLFNAMSQMAHRAPGLVGATLNSKAYAGLIADGIHVADEMMALALRGHLTPDRIFLVSDAMPTVAGPPSFELYGRQVNVKNGRLLNTEGSLAGAHFTMAEGVARLINDLGIDPQIALRMAVSIPAALIKRPDLDRLTGRRTDEVSCLDLSYNFQNWLHEI